MKRLFVYGSLRAGGPAHRLLEIYDAKLVKETRVPGFDLFALGWFPGAVRNKENKEGTAGEVYEVPDNLAPGLFEHLDLFEGVGAGLFSRQEVEIEGEPTSMYVYEGDVGKFGRLCDKIPSGDWKTRIVNPCSSN